MAIPSSPGALPLRAELGPAVEVLARLARVLERASGGLGLAHYRLLVTVAAEDQRASRLADRLALGRPAISAAVDSLAARGLISRSEEKTDHRASMLRITELGLTVLRRTESAMAAEFGELLRRTPDQAAVLTTMRELALALDERVADRLNSKGTGAAAPASSARE